MENVLNEILSVALQPYKPIVQFVNNSYPNLKILIRKNIVQILKQFCIFFSSEINESFQLSFTGKFFIHILGKINELPGNEESSFVSAIANMSKLLSIK